METKEPTPSSTQPQTPATGAAVTATATQGPTQIRVGGWCLFCGYSLKGLAREGACPECGGAYKPNSDTIKWKLKRFGPAMLEDARTLRLGLMISLLASMGFWVSLTIATCSGTWNLWVTPAKLNQWLLVMIAIAAVTGIARVMGMYVASGSRLLYMKLVGRERRALLEKLPYLAPVLASASCRVLMLVPWSYGQQAMIMAAVLSLGSIGLNALSAERLHDAMTLERGSMTAKIMPVALLLVAVFVASLPLAGVLGVIFVLMLLVPVYRSYLLNAALEGQAAEKADRPTLASEM